jgi:ElaB/YqjD/DUF883 family membrane-anchored ribosome-binding protein
MDAVLDLAEQDSSQEKRQEIDSTRSALTDKLEALEEKVMGTVQSAQETVEDSVQIAKDAVATVKRTFDIKHQVEQRPWVMVGGCFVGGVALGCLFQSVWGPSRQTSKRQATNETPLSRFLPSPADLRGNGSFAAVVPPLAPVAPSRPGLLDSFREEIDKVKGIGIGYVMGLIRDSLKESVPQLASNIDDVMKSVTAKLGGVEPVAKHRET